MKSRAPLRGVKLNIVFLGGIFFGSDGDRLVGSSKGVVQYAADNLQKSFLQGFSKCAEVDSVAVVNLPFVGAFPARCEMPIYKSSGDSLYLPKIEIKPQGFINVTVIKHLSRAISAFRGLYSSIGGRTSSTVIVCYSMHLPFLLACYVLKKFKRELFVCVVIPDLPEFMADRRGVKRLFFNVIGRISYYFVGKFNFVVGLTKGIVDKFEGMPSCVTEGMADELYIKSHIKSRSEKFILYTGTLDRRYGIRALIDSFVEVGLSDYKLVICGDGDDRQYVENVSAENSTVQYMGQLPRENIISLQKKALLLINPRCNEGEYVKYSFPSKTIEYMSSGTPLLMYRLSGVPEEYFNYCYTIDEDETLAEKIGVVLRRPIEELEATGHAAREFIINSKLPHTQVEKVLKEILKVMYV